MTKPLYTVETRLGSNQPWKPIPADRFEPTGKTARAREVGDAS
jgi:hypothetical protein